MDWNYDSDFDNELTVDLFIDDDMNYICQNGLFPRRYDTIIRYPEHMLTSTEQIAWVDNFIRTSKGRHAIFTNSPVIFNYFNVCMQRYLSKLNMDKAIKPGYVDAYHDGVEIPRDRNGLFTSKNPFNTVSERLHRWAENLFQQEQIMKNQIINKMKREN